MLKALAHGMIRHSPLVWTVLACSALAGPYLVAAPTPAPPAGVSGITAARDPAWSPDGTLLAFSILDQIWILTRDGQSPRALVAWDQTPASVERDPSWSPDGRRVAFAADRGDGFDIYVAPVAGGSPERASFLAGDERWPTWTLDGRLIFSHRSAGQWVLMRTFTPTGSSGVSAPERLTDSAFDELEPRVSPDGSRLLFVSNRDSDTGDRDLWMLPLAPPRPRPTPSAAGGDVPPDPVAPPARAVPVRALRVRGAESSPTWAPDGRRIAFSAERMGLGSLWVAELENLPQDEAGPRPVAPPLLLSRQGGQVAWSPDGRTLLVTETPPPDPGYNGNPSRDPQDPPPLFTLRDEFQARFLPAPRAPDEGDAPMAARVPPLGYRWFATFDRVWSTLQRMYYAEGANAAAWRALRDIYAPRASAARDESSLETVIDDLIAEQPLIKPPVQSSHAVVVSGHRLASEAGVRALDMGGNIVDAAIAVSFALGVVEPDASGIGGDGMALLYLKGMTEPTVIEYKDQTPIHATLDNPTIFREGRLVGDGPAAANIPGVVGGLDYLYRKYASQRVKWEDLIAPAIRHAEEGFVLDEALPTSIAEGRAYLEKYPASAEIYLPNGRLPRPGDRFINRDYAATLRTIARGGAQEFYQGAIARAIAADMAKNGGIIGYEDLAQYRAVERTPVKGRYRQHIVYSSPPPVASGASLIEALQILDRYPAASGVSYARNADYLHYVIEAWKARHAMPRVADPSLWPVDVTPHLDAAHAETLFKTIDKARAAPYRDDDEDRIGARGDGSGPDRIGRGTTAFVVADTDGNMIAVTQTLSTWGGSFYVSKGLGFLYNNHLRSSRSARGAFGQLLPLTRSSSTSAPTLVFREVDGVRTPRLAVGAAGNAWIVSSVYNIITSTIDSGLGAQAAVEAPRFLVGRDPASASGSGARVQIEDRLPRTLLADLAGRGHLFQKIGRKGEVRYGYASAVSVDADQRTVEGGADPRRSHAAMAWDGGRK